ncbi:MAG: fumarate/nitrate reduction transcriptional regulator Fnr [Lautropia sp.]|nr:fumarate/nitrate reduction transcriptional regulator Fnr [Lautropia sp.]
MTGVLTLKNAFPSERTPAPAPVAAPAASSCSTCSLHDLCLVEGLSAAEIEQLAGIVKTRRRIRRGAYLYKAGDPFDAIYPIRAGFFKSRVLSPDGREQIIGFPMPGDVLGFDAISRDCFHSDAVALEDADVCVVPFAELESIGRRFAPLQQRLHRIFSREIVRDQGLMMLLGTMRAEERVGAFLLELSRRFLRRGFSPNQFILRMTREEIGNYLGLKLETVSRTLSRLQEQGIISVEQRKLQIISHDRLRMLSGVPESKVQGEATSEAERRTIAINRVDHPWSASQSIL